MAKKQKKVKSKKIKNQFVLSVGDEGAILTHFEGSKVANRLFVDSPFSAEVKLIEKLLTTYPKLPVTMLVDVLEQNYVQHSLPPVSSLAVKKQIQKKVERELQATDLNNYLPLGRADTGRKDWNFLLISLVNAEPFSKWLEFVIKQENPFSGIYLLPVESQKLIADLNKTALEKVEAKWETLVMHNKVGGFRIVVFKDKKIVFSRLAQQLVGNNVADVLVGNLEQEVSNTVEYIKRMGFTGEVDSKLTIISEAEILQKVDSKAFSFGHVELFTPSQAAERLSIGDCVADNDKFADILVASHFASTGKHVLKFATSHTKKMEVFSLAKKATYGLGLLGTLGLAGMAGFEAMGIGEIQDKIDRQRVQVSRSSTELEEAREERKKFPDRVEQMVDILSINDLIKREKHESLIVPYEIVREIAKDWRVSEITFEVLGEVVVGNDENRKIKADNVKNEFSLKVNLTFEITESNIDVLGPIADKYLRDLSAKFPKYQIEYGQRPALSNKNSFEAVEQIDLDGSKGKKISMDTSITITGKLKNEEETNNQPG